MRCLVAIAVFLSASPAAAAVRKDHPYAGSVYESVDTHPGQGPRAPLLVVLHGDNQSATAMREVWSSPAAKRSIAVLYLQCPKALGCKGSFWSWNGDARFIDDAVDTVAADIDPERVWIAGWSGGASYLGMRAFELTDAHRYAALSFNGGGLSPQQTQCPSRVLPSFFLVGDKNPLHHLASDLRGALEGCGGEVQWDLRTGADHAAEWKALRGDADKVLAWLSTHSRVHPVAAVVDAASDSDSDSDSKSGSDSDSDSDSKSGSRAQPPPPVRCSCRVGAPAPAPWFPLFNVLACLARRGRRRAEGST